MKKLLEVTPAQMVHADALEETLVFKGHQLPPDDTALLRQCLEALEYFLTYSEGKRDEETALAAITALRERLALSDAAELAPKPGQLKNRGTK